MMGGYWVRTMNCYFGSHSSIDKEWLKELEERGKWIGKLGAQKHTYILLQFYYKFIIYYHRKIWQTLADMRILIL